MLAIDFPIHKFMTTINDKEEDICRRNIRSIEKMIQKDLEKVWLVGTVSVGNPNPRKEKEGTIVLFEVQYK